MDGTFSDSMYDALSNDTINKLRKASYRAVDLIEMFFPDPGSRDNTKNMCL